MRPDIVDLDQFYQGQLGQIARRLIRRRLREIWPDVTGLRVLGLGYATPYLRSFRDQAERVLALMPAAQGVVHWPAGEAGLVALTEESELPLPDSAVDRVLLVHGLENSEHVRPLLREIWRVLTPTGRLLVVVPNRRGLWARFETTPFGYGHPFTPPQLGRLLRDTMFLPTNVTAAVSIPPVGWPIVLRAAFAAERVGRWWGRAFAGVLVVESGKQIYAVSSGREVRRRRRLLAPLPGTAAPRSDSAVALVPTRQQEHGLLAEQVG
jgi:SAM-dependent methyltransferase